MKNFLLILEREYMTRVRDKWFIIMAILAPFIYIGAIAVIALVYVKGQKSYTVYVADQSGFAIADSLRSNDKLTFYETSDIDSVKNFEDYILLIIPEIDLDERRIEIDISSPQTIPLSVTEPLENKVEDEIERIKFERELLRMGERVKAGIRDSLSAQVAANTVVQAVEGIDISPAVGKKEDIMSRVRTNVTIHSTIQKESGEEEESSTKIASMVGLVCGFLLYMFIIGYGTSILRSVLEEKTSRIIEIIISSVKPVELMLGKIVAVSAVGISQFLIWAILLAVINVGAGALGYTLFSSQDRAEVAMQQVESTMTDEQKAAMKEEMAEQTEGILDGLKQVNIPLILGCFVFYFLSGYLLYASLFAAVGAAVDSETDSQQFVFPIIMPLLVAIAPSFLVMEDPNGAMAFWLSMIPFTAPVIMMIRLPFIGFGWELVVSMTLMVAGFVFTTWLAARIYRVGILMYGKKPTFRDLSKWLFYKF